MVQLSLDKLEEYVDDEATKTKIRTANANFNKMDISTLYVLSLALIVNTFVILFSVKNGDFDTDFVLRECIALIVLSLTITLIRIWNVKYYMLQPIIAIWNYYEGTSLGKFFYALAFLSGIVGVCLMMFVGTEDNINAKIILTIVTSCVFMVTSLFFRLHAGTYVQYAMDCPIPQHNGVQHEVDQEQGEVVPVAINHYEEPLAGDE
jgi:hypothetical protein